VERRTFEEKGMATSVAKLKPLLEGGRCKDNSKKQRRYVEGEQSEGGEQLGGCPYLDLNTYEARKREGKNRL